MTDKTAYPDPIQKDAIQAFLGGYTASLDEIYLTDATNALAKMFTNIAVDDAMASRALLSLGFSDIDQAPSTGEWIHRRAGMSAR